MKRERALPELGGRAFEEPYEPRESRLMRQIVKVGKFLAAEAGDGHSQRTPVETLKDP